MSRCVSAVKNDHAWSQEPLLTSQRKVLTLRSGERADGFGATPHALTRPTIASNAMVRKCDMRDLRMNRPASQHAGSRRTTHGGCRATTARHERRASLVDGDVCAQVSTFDNDKREQPVSAEDPATSCMLVLHGASSTSMQHAAALCDEQLLML